ncbi:MAG: glycosyl transferase group 1 [Sphingobacteriales bacterium]|nr:glycosyl transferase group 1 [Sphingobacteriales bacterium]
MKVLWITNTVFPDPSRALKLPAPVSGGWMYGLANQLSIDPDFHLSVATIYSGKEYKVLNINNIAYHLIPSSSPYKYSNKLKHYWKLVCEEINPDIVHIHGTEYPHGLSCMRECPSLNYVISIQGLVSVCARYYYAGIKNTSILKNITFRDIVRQRTIFQEKNDFERRGEFEKEYIRKANHVIGRTSWDLIHSKAIEPNTMYHFCNESLRDSFYKSDKWSIGSKINYTIFLSQAVYPIKGLHQVMRAVALLKKEFPLINVRIAGDSITKRGNWRERIKLSGYGSYIRKLIRQLELKEHLEFTGPLSEEQMVIEYKNAHLFICPSSIENSPNSLGEAQLLGVPTIAAYVGGIPDMVKHGETGLLYRFEEVEMLAECIRKVFNNDEFAQCLSNRGIELAEERHNRDINLNKTIAIYKKICN